MYHSPSVVTLQIPSAPPAKMVSYHGSRGRQLALILLGVCDIFFWVLCTTIQAMILIKFHAPGPTTTNKFRLALFVDLDYDMASAGVWGSLLYGCVGLLVICAAYEERKCLLIFTLVVGIWSLFASLVIITFSGLTTLSHNLISSQSPLWMFLECSLMVLAALGFMINLAIVITVGVVICKPCCDVPPPEVRRNSPPMANHTPQPQPTPSVAQQYGMTLCPPTFHYHQGSPYSLGSTSPIPPYEFDDRSTTPRVMLTKNSIM